MKNFRDYNFKPSDVIKGLNIFYEFTKSHANYPYAAFTIYTTEPSKCVWAFGKSRVADAITYLREECDIFYAPSMDWDDLKYKLTSKACEKEYGTADIREICPKCLVSPRGGSKSRAQFEAWRRELGLHVIEDLPWTADEKKKLMNYCMNDVICTRELEREKERIDGKEALEALRTLYYDVATCYERTLKGLADPDVDWPETSYMVEYIRKRVKVAEENVEYLCKEDKKIDSYEATLSEIADIMEPEYAGPTWSETWDDLVGRIKRMKEDNDTLRKRLKTADSNVTYFAKMKDDLQKQVNTLKDLINQIHEDSDI